METRIIDAAALQNLAAWEQDNRAKVLEAELLGDGTARARVLAVADVSWYVNVWNCRADLVLQSGYDAQGNPTVNGAGDLFDLDAAALQAVIDHVIYEDHDAGINVSGRYYPLSEKSRRLFAELLTTARKKGSH